MDASSDAAATAVAWWLGIRLCRVLGDRRQFTFPWGIGFWLIGFAALVGGISHAFATYLSEAAYFWIWKATIYSIALSVTFALAGTISATVNADRISRVLHAVNIVVFTGIAFYITCVPCCFTQQQQAYDQAFIICSNLLNYWCVFLIVGGIVYIVVSGTIGYAEFYIALNIAFGVCGLQVSIPTLVYIAALQAVY